MPNQELIKKLKIRNPELNQLELKIVFNVFFDTIIKALYNGKNVEIRNFGRFYCKKIKEKFNARNPKTGEIIYKPENIRLKFKVDKNLKKIINK